MAGTRSATQGLALLLLLLASAHALPADVFDQRQSGRVNVHVRVADATVVALLPNGALSDLMDEMYDEYEDPEDPVASDDAPPAVPPPPPPQQQTTPPTSAATAAAANTTCSQAESSAASASTAPAAASITTATAIVSTPAKRRRRCKDGFYRNQAGRCVRLQYVQHGYNLRVVPLAYS